MRNLYVYMTMSLDGFVAGPNNELDWMLPVTDPELSSDILDLFRTADAGIIGYPTYAGMVHYWRSAAQNELASEDQREFARVVSSIRGIAISNAKVDVEAGGSEVIVAEDDDALVAAINNLKRQPGNSLMVSGGVRTAQKFVRLGLVDEYRLLVHPVAISEGKRLFTKRVDLELLSTKAYASGITRVCYRSL